MSVNVTMPALGESVTEGTVTRWLKAVGDTVAGDEPLPVMPGSPPDRVESKRPPNIVMVFIDDMGWGDLSCFGNTKAATPEIDRLAAEGLRFEQFYVASPICSPTREPTMWTPMTGPSVSWTSLMKPAVPRIWLLPLPPRLYSYTATLLPCCSRASASVSPTLATSGSQ